jgi:nitrous oxidase accessory protein NosD
MTTPRCGLILTLLLSSAPSIGARTLRVHAGESIQAAVDQATPGTRILVEPGIYHEPGPLRAVTITKEGIQLIGLGRKGEAVVLEQTGAQQHGIWVSPANSTDPADDELPPCGASGQRLRGFQLRKFTVQGFDGFGVYLACVDHFVIDHNTARLNGTYSIFPGRSSHGRITANVASDTRSDACIYVGQSERVLMAHNRASGCVIGLQVENSRRVVIRDNEAFDNTTGIIADVVDGRQVTTTSDNRITDNFVHDNNLPNAAPPDADTGMLTPGIGIIVDGADRTLVDHNRIEGHHLSAMTLVNFCVGRTCPPPDIEPYPDGNRFVANRFANNRNDVLWFPGAGTDNCFRPDPAGLKANATLPVCPSRPVRGYGSMQTGSR